ncbi:MAG TPA: carboxypeptidase regulatory-like domain-containing protein [Bacteroidota bacterium]|nr:carboxypeptidase regulatory-like domain-containing protein [Bacteroidota bacterium]
MLKRYSVLTIAMVIIAAVFVQVADSQLGPPPPPSPFHFDSQPPLTGQVGIPYLYTVHLDVKDSTAVVRYRADRMDPADLTVDSATGVVRWTPTARGWYPISLVAVVRFTTHALAIAVEQNFVVAVAGGNGIVQGKVTDTLNAGIPNVAIEVLQAANPTAALPGCYAYRARTDSNGNYRIDRIDPGTYKLHAISSSPQYESQWYDGKTSAATADRITIADSPAVTMVNFTLTGGPARKIKITASGVVTDSALLAIRNTHVFFVRAGFALNSNMSIDDFRQYFDLEGMRDDFRLEGNSAEVYQTKADSLGRYSLTIPAGAYIALASAPGYGTVFYPGQTDILAATTLVLQKDSAGINFVLPQLASIATGTISGSVLDSSLNVGVAARIIATRDRWLTVDKFKEPRSYVVDTDSLGNFTINNLLPGSYFVLAVPLGSYAPAFYSEDTLTTRWKKATRVAIDQNAVDGIYIYVHQIPALMNGFADITGTLSLTSGTAPTMAGAIVYAVKNNTVAGFAVTDESGNYDIAGLAPGSYSVNADWTGYTDNGGASGNASVSYDASGNPVNASLPLSVSSVTLVSGTSSVQPVQYALEQNYPNPFNPSTTIRYTLPVSGKVVVRVFNILGQAVATLVDGEQNAGTYEVSFNASSLASGVYFYRIQSGTFEAVKKMMLLK